MKKSIAYREIGGRLQAPASKSSMQRATACSLLALRAKEKAQVSYLRSPSRSADCMAALGVAAGLGAEVRDAGDHFEIRGAEEGELASARSRQLSCGESGLCIRMFSPIAALFPGETQLGAQGTLKTRKIDMLVDSLAQLKVDCRTSAGGLPPAWVKGPLHGGIAKVDGRESSQFLTGLLVALPLATGDSELEVQSLASRGYVDLTLDTMRAFGVEVRRSADFSHFSIRGGQRYKPTDFSVEGDWSGAAFLLAAAALAAPEAGKLVLSGLNPASSQPDRAMLEALRLCGAGLSIDTASISVWNRDLKAFAFDATDCPDLFPPLVALALGCRGISEFRGAKRLAGKESDRAKALSEEFASLGGQVTVEGDRMLVRGVDSQAGGRLRGGSADSRGDHRIAMAAAISSLICESAVEIENPDCVAKSWPGFFEDLAAVAR